MKASQDSSEWYRQRSIDVLSKTPASLKAVAPALLAGLAVIGTLFRPLVALIDSLDSGAAPVLSGWAGWLLVAAAFVSVVLSVNGLRGSTDRRKGRLFLCGLCVFSLLFSIAGVVAGPWVIQFYVGH